MVQKDSLYTDEYHVYVVEDQTAITVEDEDGGSHTEYVVGTETEYTKDEYIQLMAEKNADLDEQVTGTQLAITELYEQIIG